MIIYCIYRVGQKLHIIARRVASGGRGAMPPRFSFLPPLDFFLAPPRYFFELVFLGGKNVEISDFGQKKPSDFGEDLFYFYGDHLLFGFQRKPSDFSEKPSDFQISGSDFSDNLCPPDFNSPPPRSRKAGDAPDHSCF